MRMNNAYKLALRRIQDDEGLRLFPYTDTTGNLTIGYGRNLRTRGLRSNEANFMLMNDMDECVADLNKEYPWFASQSDATQVVLIDMCFNLGFGGLKSFQKLMFHIEHSEFKEASECLLQSLAAKECPARYERLAKIMETQTV